VLYRLRRGTQEQIKKSAQSLVLSSLAHSYIKVKSFSEFFLKGEKTGFVSNAYGVPPESKNKIKHPQEQGRQGCGMSFPNPIRVTVVSVIIICILQNIT
jgi:hypothetical protein